MLTSGEAKRSTKTSLGNIRVTDEPWIHRLISRNVSGREDASGQGIRARDGKCVISGLVNTASYRGFWIGFEAAHIFPLENESYWIQYNYDRYITDMGGTVGASKINSLQNGFVMQGTVHGLFNQYLISANPDVNPLIDQTVH